MRLLNYFKSFFSCWSTAGCFACCPCIWRFPLGFLTSPRNMRVGGEATVKALMSVWMCVHGAIITLTRIKQLLKINEWIKDLFFLLTHYLNTTYISIAQVFYEEMNCICKGHQTSGLVPGSDIVLFFPIPKVTENKTSEKEKVNLQPVSSWVQRELWARSDYNHGFHVPTCPYLSVSSGRDLLSHACCLWLCAENGFL